MGREGVLEVCVVKTVSLMRTPLVKTIHPWRYLYSWWQIINIAAM